ncbi:pyrroline-5-carboxylate reductase [Avibacterium paragallinarum]|uniref:Pyrroline-5-carboxylate reductase n=1 Tax=Avibacterium paragallinarum TaxID=728 RepID=A0A377IAE1_AVIPA|nr:pyrroline-5-carboxylate reductase [Avibacterium paragallinarum]POY47391.1 pyrroline-5-carboxylate reductase [Avibacterium paragallinarum]RZN57223.1 pyrroline-5-carboxylate reductase [Avibacterium paragallinarum]RZN77066.1 pyrroline-5-carboxylate reductase [Avibacterium paragallinarum]TID25485.1 pyrroline-5-carboxylate reductase [Avibacterium paragallinarum]CDF99048.1 Putative Pyrroline-5-carboxylate reductase [Avibacterium paragallinarum JF4211]
MQQKFITFIGGGNMAQAIVFGLLKQGYPAEKITVSDPNEEKRALFAQHKVNTTENNVQALQGAEAVVLAVKPQSLSQVCQGLSAVDFSDKLVISIAAAISVEKLTSLLPSARHIIRVMPNTPALVSEGMAGLFAPQNTPVDLKNFAEDLMNAVGKSCWVKDEAEMHLITAGSGSSPAYFFFFMEVMENSLKALGLDNQTARMLVQQSALGAAKMAIEQPDVPLSTLRENVTSKGGTTAAALAVFQQQQLAQTVNQAIASCVERSQEMETLFE